MSQRIHRMLTISLQMAAMADHANWRLGAVVVKGGSYLGAGWNKAKNNPTLVSKEHIRHCAVHAEADALSGVSNAVGATIYVARITRGGDIGIARPCEQCQELIQAAGVNKVYYTSDTGNPFGYGLWTPRNIGKNISMDLSMNLPSPLDPTAALKLAGRVDKEQEPC